MARPRKDRTHLLPSQIAQIERKREYMQQYRENKDLSKGKIVLSRPGRYRTGEIYVDENDSRIVICYGSHEEKYPGEFGSVYQDVFRDKIVVHKRWDVYIDFDDED